MCALACCGGLATPVTVLRIESYSQLGERSVIIGRRCERAVVTAYRELRKTGTDDMAAFQSCTTLYRIHHPEAGLSEARALVSEWIDHHITRADTSATSGCACAED
jgi:streptomycin 6-kinase